MPKDVTRYIPHPVEKVLWGRAAGRCEFAGCNKPLWKSSVTQEEVNIAQQAHIWSFSEMGPRGHSGIPSAELNTHQNLMLVCHECHQKMDRDKEGRRYPAELLQQMKSAHEERVELVTGIDDGRKTHILLYGANIGDHGAPLSFNQAAQAVFPGRYPADDTPISIGAVTAFRDRDTEFWSIERQSLSRKFEQRVRERLNDGQISHLSVFGLAPQPLLMLLGGMLTDIPDVDVFQLRREPKTWRWSKDPADLPLKTSEPRDVSGSPALILSLSGRVVDERIQSVLGADASIWRIDTPAPHNDIMQSRSQLSQFRIAVRRLLDQIKAAHGQEAVLHVFPAVPVSVALEFGRIRMPKADLSWQVYDQINDLGGFVPALTIS